MIERNVDTIMGILNATVLPHCRTFTGQLPGRVDLEHTLYEGDQIFEWCIDAIGSRYWKLWDTRDGLRIRYLGDDPTAKAACEEANRRFEEAGV